MSNDPNKTVEISLSTLRIILFGDDSLEEVRPVSKGVGDTAKVLVVPIGIGQCLSSIDKDENYFHVEFILEGTRPHAEVWLDFEWKDSNAKLNRQRERSAEEKAVYDKNRAKLQAISSKLKSFGFNQPGFAEHLAKEILSNWKHGDYSEMLKTLSLAETLKELDNE